MSDNKLPRIPSLKELGIDPDEVEELEKELAAADSGGTPPPPKAPPTSQRSDQPEAPDSTGSASGPVPASSRKAERTPRAGGLLRGLLAATVFLTASWLGSPSRSLPTPLGVDAADSLFSQARAMVHLREIALEARPPGSPAHARVRTFLLEQLEQLGHSPTVQTGTKVSGRGETWTSATVHNITARIPGSQPGGAAVLITAHYDSRGISLGANDDGVGVVAILEALRALNARPPLMHDLIVLFTDAEEVGLFGARAFVEEHPWMADVQVVLSFDLRGGGGPALMFETGYQNGWVISQLREARPHVPANSIGVEIYKRMPNSTDFTPFLEAGKQGLNFASIEDPSVYHQAYDSPDRVSGATLQHHGEHALGLLSHFGNADLSSVNAPDVSYLSVPFVGLVTYGKLWVWTLGLAVLALWMLAVWVGFKKGARISGVFVGFVASLVYLGGIGVGAVFLYRWLIGFHPETGALNASSFHNEGWYVLAMACAVFALGVLTLAVLRRRFGLLELGLGVTVLPVLLAVAATVFIPLGAMNFQWPVLAASIGILAVAGVGPGERMSALRLPVALAAAVPVIVVLTPLIKNVWLAMGLMLLAPAVTILMGLTVLLIFPALDLVREPNRWWAPLTGLLAAVVFMVAGIATAGPSAEHPAPSTLVYTLDRETGVAHWGTDPTASDDAPGMVWSASVAGNFTQAGPDLAAFGVRHQSYRSAPAQAVTVEPPSITTQDGDGPGGLLRLVIASGIGAEMIAFRMADGEGRLVAVNGTPLDASEPPTQVVHWGAGPEGVVFDFLPEPGEEVVSFILVEHLLRPEELLGQGRFSRPPELAPNVRQGSDRAMILTPITVHIGDATSPHAVALIRD